MPAEAPAAPPPVSTSPGSAPATPPSVSGMDKFFSDLEDAPPAGITNENQLDAKSPQPAPSSPKGASSEPIPSEPGKEGSTKGDNDKPAAPPPKPAAETDDQEPPAQGKASDLRNWGKRQMEKAKKLKAELDEVRTKLAEREQAPEGDAKTLAEELEATKKRLEEYEGNIRMVKYEKSQEYQDKYLKPYQEAVQQAYAKVVQLKVYEKSDQIDEDTGERKIVPRKATTADLDQLYQLVAGNDAGTAIELAQEKFGPAANYVMAYVDKIHDLALSSVKAINENKERAAEQEKQMTAQQAAQQQQRLALWQKTNQELETKYSKWFGKRDGDEEWNAALLKGREIADLAFSDRKGLSPQQNIVLDAQIRHRASAFPALKGKVTKLETELAAAQKTIEELRSSGPGKPKPSAEAPAGKKTWEQELDERLG